MELEQTQETDYMVILQNAIVECKKQIIRKEYQDQTSDALNIAKLRISKARGWF